jgi:5-oxoprolinase (ATP-hydrolysing) subunit C
MLRIINGGIETLVEDWPGRLGFLGKGMASSGAMDNVALQFANLLGGKPPRAKRDWRLQGDILKRNSQGTQ